MVEKNYARSKFFDVTRGWAMVFLIILHPDLHLWTGAEAEQSGAGSADFLWSLASIV